MWDKRLKKCPHCGGRAVLNKIPIFPEATDYLYEVHCHECECGTNYKAKEQQAINSWNQRFFMGEECDT